MSHTPVPIRSQRETSGLYRIVVLPRGPKRFSGIDKKVTFEFLVQIAALALRSLATVQRIIISERFTGKFHKSHQTIILRKVGHTWMLQDPLKGSASDIRFRPWLGKAFGPRAIKLFGPTPRVACRKNPRTSGQKSPNLRMNLSMFILLMVQKSQGQPPGMYSSPCE